MAGSNIFVMYTSADGTNVTVSPRLGKGHYMPLHDEEAQITLLEGSGVSNGIMTANVQCSNCQSWEGGTMDFTSSSTEWIYAYKSGSPLNSDSLTESIPQHDYAAPLTWDIAGAKGGNDVNPFLGTTPTGSSGSGSVTSFSAGSGSIPSTCTPIADAALLGPSGSGCPTAWPSQFSTSWPTVRPSWVASCYPSGPPFGAPGNGPWPTSPPWVNHNNGPPKQKRDDGCPSGYESISVSNSGFTALSPSEQKSMLLAHGVLACIAFVALLPTGSILIRLASFTGLVWVHAGLQMFAYVIYVSRCISQFQALPIAM